MKLRIGITLWILALGISGLQYVFATDYNYTLSATGYRYAATKLGNTWSSYVCLGPSTWTASGHTENWSAIYEDNTEAWMNAPPYDFNETSYPNLAIAYKSQAAGCDNPNGVSGASENGFTIYPTGLYGAFVSHITDDGGGEWQHRHFERPVRSMPLGWKVAGSI